MTFIRRLLALAASVFVLALPLAASAQAVLRVSAIPDEAPTELQRKFKPLGEYLARKIGMKVDFVPVTDYAATVEGLASGKLDLVWLGGFTFVQAELRSNGRVIPLVQREEDERFRSVFIARADSGINSLQDLKGKTVSFGSPSSTSGHLMPRAALLAAHIDPERDFKQTAFSGTHDATIAAVAGGKVEAGALNISVWQKALEEKKVDPSQVRVFYTTPPFHDYNWTVRSDLDPAVRDKIRAAFLALDPADPKQKEILDLQRATRFVPTSKGNYDGIEAAARSAGLIQ